MKVIVTQKAIDDGIAGDPEHCPVANAIKDAGDPLQWVAVGKHVVHVGEQSYLLPPKAETFIREFDAEEYGLPFTFHMTKISDKRARRITEDFGN